MTAPARQAPATSRGADVWRRFRRNRLAMVGLTIVLVLVLTAASAHWLAPEDPATQSLRDRRAPPDRHYLLGADEFGRDILSRIIYGTRASMLISLTSVGFGLLLGSTLGAIAGYAGGLTDAVIMRVMDLLLAFPTCCSPSSSSQPWGRASPTPSSPSASGPSPPSRGSPAAR